MEPLRLGCCRSTLCFLCLIDRQSIVWFPSVMIWILLWDEGTVDVFGYLDPKISKTCQQFLSNYILNITRSSNCDQLCDTLQPMKHLLNDYVPFPSIYQAIHPSMYPCVILFWPCLIWAGHSLASVHCCLKYSFSLAKFILGAHVLFPDVSSEFISGRVLPSCYYWACFTAHSLRLGKNVLIQLVVRFS